MTNDLTKKYNDIRSRLHYRLVELLVGVVLLTAVAGCQTGKFNSANSANQMTNSVAAAKTVTLREGDILKISFPGSPNLDTTQQIRRDGKISPPLVGEVKAAGLTPSELQSQLIALYAPQLVTKEITVEVENATFPIYVTGAVLHPGKIVSNHPMTALEAIMEAGGFDYTKADLKNVTIIRQEENGTKNCILDLKKVMDGKTSEPFYLNPADIIYVPERFQWF